MPILSVLLGYIFFKETLNKKRILSIILVFISILILILFSLKSLPWVGLIVAFVGLFTIFLERKLMLILMWTF